MEHGRIVDSFANAELKANMGGCTSISEFDMENERAEAARQRNRGRNAIMKTECRQPGVRRRGLLLATAAQAEDSRQDRRAHRHVGLYADIGGPGSVLAAKMAVEDFGLAAPTA